MKIMMFAASLRQGSFNKKLIQSAADIVQSFNHQIDLADFNEFDMPHYNADIQESEGIPQSTLQFIERMHSANALIISSPEYNFSIPGNLKNVIDWVSRVNPMPWQKQRVLLMSASPSMVGGNRGLWATRVPLEACGAIVYPDMFFLASSHEAFDEKSQLKNAMLKQRLTDNIKQFLDFCERLS